MIKVMEAEKNKIPRIAIFGAGSYGQNAIDYLRNIKKDHANIIALFDNDTGKQGNKVLGLPILSPAELPTLDLDEIWIASIYAIEIKNQLLSEFILDPKRIHIIPADGITKKKAFANVENAINLFKDLISIIEDNRIHWWLDHSSLLGLLRSGDPIGLGDIDMAVLEEEPEEITKIIRAALPDSITIRKCYFNYNGASDIWGCGDVTEIKIDEMIDIHFKRFNKNLVHWMVGPIQLAVPSVFYTENEKFFWSDITMPIPVNPNAYLEELYGNWRTPNSAWTYADYNNIQKIFGGVGA